MTEDGRSELLVKCGFIKKDQKENYSFNETTKEYEPKEGFKFKSSDADEEYTEIVVKNPAKTGFPVPLKRAWLMWEIGDLSLEEPYFWFLDMFKSNFQIIEKLEDSFAAAENSAFFGVTQQRLGAQQDRVSQFLATMGKMIKELFQMVRELRIIEERLDYYSGVEKELSKPLKERKKGDEITLKGLFVDLVQGGGKSAASVYGMARELEFVTLPDLFFDAPPFKDKGEMENYVNQLGENFNRNVLRVLIRHLNQYTQWRERTTQEHRNRQRFMLKYLQQHYDIVMMYLNWVKPYLKHVSKLTMKEKNMESAEIVSAFETSMLDIEFIARNRRDDTQANGCVLATFKYRTRAELKVQQEGYQRGPVHIGRMEVVFRAYAWTDKQLDNYKRLKEKEAFILLGEISSSIKDAMESLGDELQRYLREAKGEKEEKKEEKKSSGKAPQRSLREEFFGGFSSKKKGGGKGEEIDKAEQEADLKKLGKTAEFHCYQTFHLFKKAHGMIAW
ncbi:MAG: hypothetical protein KKA62_06050 [Nanoarchaeota archaeon]|nr:hypothetical protein [Nanoarchaeota archaeon]MBU1644358.1 hypothetical protein [Nanoarchaeota archaeon]MBU1977487.1 hypothetical protein [Nanoarchaeota archaeon]